ncbi:MAG: flagellar biosynthesis protein FlhF, partial [Treponema sp.]|nr:flagellar biosynthesis protein FlhF [Treponema sp.]
MAYFTEQARTPTECYQKIRTKYGDRAKVLQQRTVLKGGLFGIGGHEEVEMTGTCGQEIFAPQPEIRPRPQVQPRSFDLEQIKQEILAAAGKTSAAQGKGDPALQALVKEVQGLSKKLEDRIIEPAERADHPALKKLEEDMGLNDFSPSFTKKILDRTRGEFSLDELGDYEKVQARAAEWIGECITLYQEPEIPDAKT